MKIIFRILSIASLSMLAACASVYNDGTNALNAGDLAKAEQLLNQAIREGDSIEKAYNNLGVLKWKLGQQEIAIRYFTMAARYGNPLAQQTLTNLGKPVPPADLANSGGERMSGAEALLLLTNSAAQGYTQGRQQAPVIPQPPKQINCTSTAYGKTTETNCKQ